LIEPICTPTIDDEVTTSKLSQSGVLTIFSKEQSSKLSRNGISMLIAGNGFNPCSGFWLFI